MTRVSIIDFCSDMKKHSAGLSENEIAINKIKCGRRRVFNLRSRGKEIQEGFEDDEIVLDDADVPDCISTGDCVDLEEVGQWTLNKLTDGGEVVTGMAAGLIGNVFEGITGQGNNDLLVGFLLEELGELLLMRLASEIYNKTLIKTVSIACREGVSFVAMNVSKMYVFAARVGAQVTGKALSTAATKAATSATTSAATTGAEQLAGKAAGAAACPPCAVALVAIVLFQVGSVIFDAVDPFGCNDGVQTVKQFNAEVLDIIQDALDTEVRDTYLSAYSGGIEMPDGTVIGVENRWPMEYDVLNMGNTDLVEPHPDTIAKVGDLPLVDEDGEKVEYSWLALELILASRYMGALTRNSYGQKINFAPNTGNERLLTLSDINLKEIRGALALRLSNNNTDMAKWIYAWWPLLLFVFFILVFVIIKLII